MDPSIGSSSTAGYVDFKAVSSAAIVALAGIVPRILPKGYREDREWIVRNPTRSDATLGSFKINLRNGVWSDFATADRGGDVIDLLAYDDAARDAAQSDIRRGWKPIPVGEVPS